MEVKKLHAGSGKNYIRGWINTDIGNHKKDLVWDMTQALGAEDASFDAVFCEHVIEHFTRQEGEFILSEFYRVLVPGGVLRLSTVNLSQLISTVYNQNFFNMFNRITKRNAKTISDVFDYAFRENGHKFIYDERSLKISAKHAGFKFNSMKILVGNETSYPDVFCWDRRVFGKTSSFKNLVLEVVK